MAKISDTFKLHTARATGFDRYTPGDVAYVTNGFRDNGVVGFVKPQTNDYVYRFLGIVLSAFCEATVQIPPFIARGNGGSGLIILEPLKTMTADQLAYIAAFINTNIRWRFSWSRMATVDRIRDFEVPDVDCPPIRYRVKLAHNVTADLDSGSVTRFTEGISGIYEEVQALYRGLRKIVIDSPEDK